MILIFQCDLDRKNHGCAHYPGKLCRFAAEIIKKATRSYYATTYSHLIRPLDKVCLDRVAA
jgi:hypothetical protein